MKTHILLFSQNQFEHYKKYRILGILFFLFLGFQGLLFGQATTTTFNYTGALQTWIVPPCVYSIQVDVRGAKGGNANIATGGNGARVQATIAVTPGQTLNIYVGGQGGNPAGGWNGGGNGVLGFAPGGNSRGGGGASDIRIGGTALANRVVVAGGGGGGGGGVGLMVQGNGGAGGCATGVNGTSASPSVGVFYGVGGGGGTTVAGGNGGSPWGSGNWGTNGSLGQGGNGGYFGDASGGGGGGGRYGGGGGGSDGCCSGANGGGGGGGGSSLTPAGGTCTGNYNNGAGLVSITYTPGIGTVLPTNTGPYCEGATISLNCPTTTGGTYDWSGPGGYTALNTQNPTIPGATAAMAGVYTVTVTIPGCTSTGTTTVVVNPNPTPNATNTGPYCSGNTIQLNSPTGSATDDWAGPAGYMINDVQNPTIAGANPAMTGNYTVTVTNAFNCSATASTMVTVNALPVANANNTGPYCEGDVVDITSGGGIDYDWAGPGGFVLNNTQNATYPSAAMPMNGTYTVTVTDANNCSSTATTSMVVNLLPIPVANNDGPYCEGDPIYLTSGGGATYGWAGPNSYSNGTQNPTINPSVVANSGTYTVLVTTTQGCTGTATTDVEVTAVPIPVANNTGPYCEGQRVDLSVVGGSSWVWAGPLAFTSGLQNPTISNSIPTNTGIYTVTATDGAGCSATATTSVLVSPTPTAVPQFSPQNPSMLKPEVNFSESSYSNIVTYVWDIDGIPYNTSTFSHTFADPGDYPSYLVVTNIYGCIDTTFFNVHVDPQTSIFIPNSFTPNGDDLNEIFYVYGMGWERMEMIIFDRWGNEVFYSTDPSKGWNGTRNNNGEALQEGTYAYKVYIIDLYGDEHNFMGHVNVIR